MIRIVIVAAASLAFTLIKGTKSPGDDKPKESKFLSWLDPASGPGVSHNCG